MGREAESCLLCLWLVLALCVVLWVLCSLGSGGVGLSLIAHLSSALTRGVLGWCVWLAMGRMCSEEDPSGKDASLHEM